MISIFLQILSSTRPVSRLNFWVVSKSWRRGWWKLKVVSGTVILNHINYFDIKNVANRRGPAEVPVWRRRAERPTTPSILCFWFSLIGRFFFFCHQWKCEYYRLSDGGEWSCGGCLWYVFTHLWEMHDLTPPPPPWSALRGLPPKHPPPFMCIDVKFVHKTRHLLTFICYFYQFLLKFLFHLLGF